MHERREDRWRLSSSVPCTCLQKHNSSCLGKTLASAASPLTWACMRAYSDACILPHVRVHTCFHSMCAAIVWYSTVTWMHTCLRNVQCSLLVFTNQRLLALVHADMWMNAVCSVSVHACFWKCGCMHASNVWYTKIAGCWLVSVTFMCLLEIALVVIPSQFSLPMPMHLQYYPLAQHPLSALCQATTMGGDCLLRSTVTTPQIFLFFGCFVATQLVHHLHQERSKVVCSNKEAWKCLDQRHSRKSCHICVGICACSWHALEFKIWIFNNAVVLFEMQTWHGGSCTGGHTWGCWLVFQYSMRYVSRHNKRQVHTVVYSAWQNHSKLGRGTAPWDSWSSWLAESLRGPRTLYIIYTKQQDKTTSGWVRNCSFIFHDTCERWRWPLGTH